MSNQNIRTHFRQQRQRLSAKQQQQASDKILAQCLASTKLQQAKIVACYLTNDGEIDPSGIIRYCWEQKKTVLLPVLHPVSKGHLVFVEYRADSPMRPNRYGIDEPVISSKGLYPLNEIELIFTPLVAFDPSGNRLGMGGGYYDRTLAPIRRDNLAVQLIGLAHICQQADSLDNNFWDIPLHGIATPERFFKTNT